jgi:hypothetical protein
VPDFISNSGGVHLYESVDQDAEPEDALVVIESAVGEAVTRTLASADELGITPVAAALRDARDYLAATTGVSSVVLDELIPV